MATVFLTFIHDNYYHNGIAELLTVLISIIDGFMTPLREEHRQFFCKVLILLHSSPYYREYHTQMTQCVMQYITKDRSLIQPFFNYILKHWPKEDQTDKQVLLLKNIRFLMGSVPVSIFPPIEMLFFKRIARCIASEHFMIAEAALSFFSAEPIVLLVVERIHVILPMLYGPLQWSVSRHWNPRVRGMCSSILQLFLEIDPDRFTACYQLYMQPNLTEQEIWNSLETLAQQWKRESES